MSEKLRLFVALELPPHVLEALEAVQRDLRVQVPERAARWVRPEGIHLTLKFLGDVPAGQVGEIEQGLHAAAKGHAPFELRTEGLGVFPNPKRARVLWVPASRHPAPMRAVGDPDPGKARAAVSSCYL